MAKMRSLAPAFIISVGILFVLFMVISDSSVLQALGGRTNDVGSVNGDAISYQEFAKILDQQRESQKQQTGKDIDEENMDQFRDQVWNAVVTQKILAQQIENLGITVADQEIKDIILSDNPPDFLKQNFIDSTGKFNAQLYQQALFDPRNSDALIQAEEVVRQNRLNQKLQSMLLASITVSDAELKRKFEDQNTDIKADYAIVEFAQFPDSMFTVTQDEMKSYYDDNLDKYKIDAQRRLKYVLFREIPSAGDTQSVKSTLENIISNFKEDTASFKSYVDIYSETPYSIDTTKVSGFFPVSQNAIADAKRGDIVGPVKTNNGYGIYRILNIISARTGSNLDKKMVYEKIDIPVKVSATTKDELKNSAADFSYLAKKGDFFNEAKLMKYEVKETPPFKKDAYIIQGIGINKRLMDFAFENDKNTISDIFSVQSGYVVVMVSDVIGERVKTFSEVEAQVRAVVLKSKKEAKARELIAKIKSQVGNDLGKISLAYPNVKVDSTGSFTPAGFIPGIGRDYAFLDKALETEINKTTEPVKGIRGYYLIKVTSRTPFDQQKFELQKNSLRDQLLQEKKQAFFGEWLAKKKEEANIVDDRYIFYGQ